MAGSNGRGGDRLVKGNTYWFWSAVGLEKSSRHSEHLYPEDLSSEVDGMVLPCVEEEGYDVREGLDLLLLRSPWRSSGLFSLRRKEISCFWAGLLSFLEDFLLRFALSESRSIILQRKRELVWWVMRWVVFELGMGERRWMWVGGL